MEDWQQRVVDEHDQLVERVEKLQAFFPSEKSHSLDEVDGSLLDAQLLLMIAYGKILESRIDRFSK